MTRHGLTLSITLLLLAGCASQPTAVQDRRLREAQATYARQDYAAAYRQAVQLHGISRGAVRDEAAYLAGLSAHRAGNAAAAEPYLRQATRAENRQLAGEAHASLGLIYSERGRYDLAARELTAAAPRLTGEDKANAHFYAAVAQQKLGQWAQARTNLVLARAATQNDAFRQQVESQLAVTGYTIQVGAFRGEANARRAADSFAGRAELHGLGVPRLVESHDAHNVPITLVHLGRFSTFQAAHQARQKIGANQAIIVPLSR